MVFGPCGGVRPGGACEVDTRPCPFVETPAPSWPAGASVALRLDDGWPRTSPLVICDARPSAPTLSAAAAMARAHEGWCDAVLLGDHHDRVDLPASLIASACLEAGIRPWVTLTCRDRNAVALEGELAACSAVGVREVHCVTGDARAAHIRPDTTEVFDLDSLRLVQLARTFDLTVSVAESPLAEPVGRRPARAADKSRAGASWCFLNVGVGAARAAAFVTSAREAGSTMRFVACIAVFTDEPGASRLAGLPGVILEESAVRRVLGAGDPVQAGIEEAVMSARQALAVDGIDAVDLSGPASTASDAERVAVMRAVAERVRVDAVPPQETEGAA